MVEVCDRQAPSGGFYMFLKAYYNAGMTATFFLCIRRGKMLTLNHLHSALQKKQEEGGDKNEDQQLQGHIVHCST